MANIIQNSIGKIQNYIRSKKEVSPIPAPKPVQYKDLSYNANNLKRAILRPIVNAPTNIRNAYTNPNFIPGQKKSLQDAFKMMSQKGPEQITTEFGQTLRGERGFFGQTIPQNKQIIPKIPVLKQLTQVSSKLGETWGGAPARLGVGLMQVPEKETRKEGLKNIAMGGIGTALTIGGAKTITPKFAIGSGIIGSAFGGGGKIWSNIQEGRPLTEGLLETMASQGIESAARAVPMSKIMQYTAPAIENIGKFAQASDLFKNMPDALKAQILDRTLGSILNVGEGIIIDRGLGLETDATSIGLDVVTGAITGTGGVKNLNTRQSLRQAQKELTKSVKESFDNAIKSALQSGIDEYKRLHPEASDDVAVKAVKEFWRNEKGQFASVPKKDIFIKDSKITDADRRALRRKYGLPEDGRYDKGFIDLEAEIGGKPKPEQPTFDVKMNKKGEIKIKTTTPEVKMPDTLKSVQESQKLSLKDTIGKIISDTKTAFVDPYSALFDPLYKFAKQTKSEILPQHNIDNQISRVLSSDTIASQFLRDNGFESAIRNLETKQDIDQLGEYLIAKRNIELGNRVETGRSLESDRAFVESTKGKYEEPAKVITDIYRKFTQMAIESGLVDRKAVEDLIAKNPDYVRLERLFSPEEATTFKGTKGTASISKQSVIQNIKGSKREIQNPLISLIERAYKIVNEVERNRAAKMITEYRNIPGNPYGLNPLRLAENVKKRIDLYSNIKELKPLKTTAERIIKTRGRYARRLSSEINKLNKLGLQEYMNRPDIPDELVQPYVSKIKIKKSWKKPTIITDTGDKFKGKPVTTKTTIQDENIKLTNKQVKELVQKFVAEPPEKIAAIKRKLANKEPKLKILIDEISQVKTDLDMINAKRKSLWDEAQLLRDAESRGKSTISYFKDGIKEIWEVNKNVADAAKNLNAEQMGILAKIISVPMRIFKVSTTGLRFPFLVRNIVRDQLTGFINSSHAAKTSLLNPAVTFKSIFEAVGHGKDYDQLVREGALQTSFDIYRSNPKITLDEIYARKNIKEKVKYKATNPAQLFRSLENILSRGEEFTRIQQYRGTYDALIQNGRSVRDAQILAAQAARQNTADFQRIGNWSKVINWIIPYFSSGIAGSRSFMNAVKRDPAGTGVKMTAAVFMPMIASTLWNTQDEKRRIAYDDISEFEKENNFILIPPNPTKDDRGSWNVIKVPITPGLANLANISRQLTLATTEKAPVVASKIFSDLVAATTSLNIDKPGTYIPQVIKPALEAQYNINTFTGKDIVPENLQMQPKEEQVYPWTSGTIRAIAKATNQSPLVLQHLIKGYFGGTATDVIGMIDKELANNGVIPQEQAQGMDPLEATISSFNKAYGGEAKKKLKEITTKDWNTAMIKAYDYMHSPKTLDENGFQARDRNESMAFAQIRLANPQIVAREAAEARLRSIQDGTPYNPLYDLPYDRQRVVLTLSTLPPGPDKSALQKENIDWLKPYWNDVASYSNEMKRLGIFKENPNYETAPKASARAQALMDAGNWNDPEVKAYLQANNEYKNRVRAELGLPPLESTASKWGSYTKKPKKVSFNMGKVKKARVVKSSPKKIFGTRKISTPKIKAIQAPRIRPVARIDTPSIRKVKFKA